MKNQIDQSTPFLAFYDLLRIRGVYSEEEKREKLRRGFRRAMALAAVLVGLLLPQGAVASVLGDLADENGVISPGSHRGLPGESDNPLLENGDLLKIGTNGKGNALFQTDGSWRTTGGELSGGLVYLLANGGISFEGGSFNVEGLVAAAIGKSEFRLGDKLEKSDVTGSISGSAGGAGFRVYVGKTVGASSGTIVETDGMSDGSSFTIESGGGTITFSGDIGSGNLKAKTVNFVDGSSTSASVTAEDGVVQVGDAVAGSRQDEDGNDVETLSFNQNAERSMTQNAGTISASTISGAIDQKAGTIDAGTSALTLGSGSSLGGSVTAGSVSVGNTGTLTLTGNAGLEDTTVTAGTLKLDQAGTIELNQLAVGTLQGTADSLKATKTGAGELKLGTLDVSSLDVTACGVVSQVANTALTVSGAANVTAQNAAGTTKYNVTLTQANNTFGSIGATGANVSITESDGVKLNDVTATGTLTVNAGDAVTQSGAAKVTGATSVTVADGRAVTLGNAENKFSSIGVVGKTANTGAAGAVTIVDSDSTLALNAIRASDLTVTAAGNVTQSAAANVAGAATVTAQNSAGTTKYNVTLTQANTFGSVGATGANVQITESDAVALDAVSASSLTVNAGGNITQNGATTISDNGDVTLGAGANAIELSKGVSGAGTLTLSSDTEVSADITASSISASGKALSQSGGSVDLGSGTLTAASFAQTGGEATFGSTDAAVNQNQASGKTATINATTLSGEVTQNAGTIKARNTDDGLSISTLATQSGEIDASGATLTLASGSTVGGTVKAGNIALSGPGTKTLTQNGANSAITVSGGSFLASGDKFTQNSGTLTLSNPDGNTVNANVTQEGGAIRSQNGALTFATAVDNNAGTIGVSGQNVTFNGNVKQSGSGKIVGNTVTANGNIENNTGIEATTLTLGKADQAYTLGGANKISTLSGSAASVSVNNGANALTVKDIATTGDLTVDKSGDLTLGSTANNAATADIGGTVTVTDAGTVSIAGLKADSVVVAKSGAVTDTDAALSAHTANDTPAITLGTGGDNKVASVLLDDSAKLAVAGVQSDGNVGIKAAAITQSGAISGKNVTLDQTAGNFAVGNNISAKGGDILVKSAGTLATGNHELSTTGGNIVLSGAGVTVDGSTLSAAAEGKGVGMTSSGALTVKDTTIIAPTVVLETTGTDDLTVDTGVAMKTSSGSPNNDASLIINAGGEIKGEDLLGANRPAENLSISKGRLTLVAGQQVGLNHFAYRTTGDVDIKFTGAELALESTDGSVTVTADNDITIVKGANMFDSGSGESISARNALVADSTASDAYVSATGSDGSGGGSEAVGGLIGTSVKLKSSADENKAGGSVTVASGAKISSNGDLELKTADGKDFTVAQGGTVESTTGKVSITSKGKLDVGGTVKTTAKTISLKTEGDSAGGITLAGDVSTYNSGNSATITLSSKTGEIEQTGGTMVGYSVNAANQTIKQTGNARIEAITTATGITATKIEQTGGGLVAAVKIAGDFEQSGNGGTLTTYSGNAITVTGKVTQNAENGQIGEVTDSGTPKQTITLGSLDQDAGTINATTLTLRNDSTSGGTITAGSIVIQTADETPVLKTLTQDGAGTITADSITASTVEQSHVGTETAHATINADTINAALTQSGAYAAASAKTAENGISISGALTQSAQNATVGAAGQNVTLEGGATQVGHGKVLADTLTLAGNDKAYNLVSTEGNAVSAIEGTAKSVAIHDGTTALELRVNVGTGDDHTVSVLKAGNVTLDGTTAKSITVNEAGDVADTASQTAATTVSLGDAANNKTIGKATLTKSAGAITINGINATGDVAIQNDSITQSGAISGQNVTLDQTADTAEMKASGDITATGDILVRSAGAVSVGGEPATPSSLSAENGSVVIKGVGATTVQNASLTAKEIGVESTDGDVSLGNATFVATGTAEGMDGVVLKSSGDMTIGAGVAAKTSDTATENEAPVTMSAGGKLTMAAANQPTKGEKLSVSAGSIGGIDITAGDTLDVNSFVYTHTDETKKDLNFKFTGSTLSILNEKGAVTVTTDGQDLSIVKSAATGNGDVEVVARDLLSTAENDTDRVEKVSIAGSDPAGSDGIVAKGDITVDGSAGAGTVTVNGTVSSDEGAVSLKSGGAIEVAAGGKVETKTADKGVTLTTTGDNAKDITVAGATTVNGTEVAAGTVTSAGNLDMTSATDIALAGAVSAEAGKATLKAANGEVKQTAGTVSVKDLDISAKNINQTGGAITATGATSLEATDDSISLAATTGTGNNVSPANDFATVSKAVAKNAITISDKNALTIAGAAGSANGATATEGDISITAVDGLTVTAAVNAGGDATLAAATIDAQKAVTAGGKVTATATGADAGDTKAAAFAGTVTGGTDVELTAANGTLTTVGVEATIGDATLSAKTIAVGGAVTAGKKVTATATGVDVGDTKAAAFAGTVTGGTDVELKAESGTLSTVGAVTASTKDATLTGALIDAQGTVTASSGLVSMTATAGSVQTKAVSGQNVVLEATTGVTEGGAVNAANDKFVHTTGGNIAINSDFSAKNAVYKADNGAITIGDKISGVTDGLGLEGNGLTVDGTKISGVNTLVVNSKTGDITITGKPDGVQNFAVAAAGNVTVGGGANGETAVEGDFTFTDGRVVASVPTGKAEADRTVNVTGLQAGNDLKVNITGTLTTPAATAGGTVDIDADTVNMANGTVTATRGNVDIDATTANVGTATAGGEVTVDATAATVGNATANGGIAAVRATTGDATVGNLSGTAAEVSSQNGNVVLTGTATARTGDANVTASNGTVTGGGNVNAAGEATVTAVGNVTAANITGAAGTTVTAENGGAINVAGNLGQGGDTVVNANGAAVNAGTLASGGLLNVNNAGAVTANIAAGGNANIQAANIQAGNTQAGGNLVLQVGGDANVGQIAVGGDVNGNVGGVYTVAGGNVGTMGQGGDFTTGQFTLEGDLASGDVTMDAGTLQMDGNLDAGGAAVDITAGGGIQGGGVLTAGPLSLAGGAIGAAGAAFQVNTATLQNIAGTGVYLVDTAGGTIAINVIDASGDLDLNIPNAAVAGGGSVSAGGDMTLTVNQQFGTLANPVNITVGGTLTIDGVDVPLLHIAIDGNVNPSDVTILYNAEGFAIWGNAQKGYQIIGAGPEKQRLINRALAFTVNTPELKSKQGIFGDPAFIHTRMNVSEARAAANMDMLALNAVDFYDTWEHVQSPEGRRTLRKWAPKVDMGLNSLLSAKLAAQASEMETQPEVWVPGQAGDPSPAPAAPAAE